MFKCRLCEFETENKNSLANHVRWKHKYSEEEKLSSFKKRLKKAIDSSPNRLHRHDWIEVEEACKVCGKIFLTKRDRISGALEKSHCSRSCANTHGADANKKRSSEIWSSERRKRQGEITASNWKNEVYSKQVMSTSKRWTSKREVEIRTSIIEKYPEDEWTFGSIGSFEGKAINPDLWSRKLKIIFEYDGVWHFQDIHGQLSQKKEQDARVERFALAEGYRLIRVDEDAKLSLEEIEKLIYERQEVILKIGERY